MTGEYEIVIVDKISCQCYVNWTYEENSKTQGRKELLDLQLQSAINTAYGKNKILAMTSITKKEIEEAYDNDERGLFHVGCLTEASEELNMPHNLTEEDSILKVASLLKWKGIKSCILTGNSLLFNNAKTAGFDVYNLNDVGKIKVKKE